MLKYLIVLLDDTSVSYCHYENRKTVCNLIPLEILKDGILFALKRKLQIQFVYPEYTLPVEYLNVIESVDHVKIMPSDSCDDSKNKVVVIDGWNMLTDEPFHDDLIYVLRTDKIRLFENYDRIVCLLRNVLRLNVVITDVGSFSDDDFDKYKEILDSIAAQLLPIYAQGKNPQLNIITDRIALNRMNNCNAGCENITLAPNGLFYVCPAFYQNDSFSIGSLEGGLTIKNPQLYKYEYAPLCRKCDAFQCKRCVWLNQKLTLEVNTPSHEQCVCAHLERNASRALLNTLCKSGSFNSNVEIKELEYLDPFDAR